MPREKPGHTHVTIEVPDELLARVHAKRGKESLTAFACRLFAKDVGAKYAPPARGRPVNKGSGSPG